MHATEILFLAVTVMFLLMSALLVEWQLSVSHTSQRELMRRANAGNQSAKNVLRRDGQVPRLKVIRVSLVGLIFGLGIVMMTQLIGTAWSVASLILIVAVYIWLRQLRFIKKLTRVTAKRIEKFLLRKVTAWNWLSRFERPETETGLTISSLDELRTLVAESSDAIGNTTAHQVLARMGFDKQIVGSRMTALAEIDSISQGEVLGPLVLDDLHKTGHSHFPVTSKDINHVVGILDLPKAAQLTKQSSTAKSVMDLEPIYIREDHSLLHALHGFLHTHRHLFIVVNEQRETVGVLSLRDVIETLVGQEIDDDFDQFDDLSVVAAHQYRNNATKGKKT